MKRILTALLCTALLLCCFAGCTPNAPANTDDPVTTPQGETDDTTEPADTTLHTAVLGEVDETQFTNIYEYGDDEYECYILWCESTMEDFCYLGVAYDAESDSYSHDGSSYSFGTVNAGEAVKLKVSVPEVVPAAAVSYTIDGVCYEWILAYNGRDGGISLIEQSYE